MSNPDNARNPLDTYAAHIAALLLALDPNAHLWAEMLKNGRQRNIEFAIKDKLDSYRGHVTGGFVISDEDKALAGSAVWAMNASERLPVIAALTDGTGEARLAALKERQKWTPMEDVNWDGDAHNANIIGEKFKVLRARRTGEKRIAQNEKGEALLNDKGEPRVSYVREQVKNQGRVGVACDCQNDSLGMDVLLRFDDGTHSYHEITRLRHIPA